MTFSATNLAGDQPVTDADVWRKAAQKVHTAVIEALPQIPSAEPLIPDSPVEHARDAAVPEPVWVAITAFLGGGTDGKILLMVGQELVEALAGTPFGAVDPAQALTPALETIAEALGGRLEKNPTTIAVEDAMAVLAGGTTVLMPLLAGDAVHALVGVSLTVIVPAAGTGAARAAATGSTWGIDMLRDVEMEVTCELGRTRMTVRQLLALAPGDVVELDRLAGSPADLLVNGTLLARGEVVVVDEGFGLRITEIVTKDAT
jgi:flagellar motor switch protein FliN/FliY